MTIMVLGAGGMLGTFVSKLIPSVAFNHDECDITKEDDLEDILYDYLPEVVINCAGITNKTEIGKEIPYIFEVNSRGPHLIADICDRIGARLIHISTDCVFSGQTGAYTEQDRPDPDSIYGISKLFGEVTRTPHVTLRTSFLGYPDSNGRSLLAWASRQQVIPGYVNHYWNGVTAYELATRVLPKVIKEKTTGLLHIHGRPYTKYEILEMAATVYGWDYDLQRQNTPIINRTLSSLRKFDYEAPDLFDMLMEMEQSVWWNQSV